jgi:hypothetical protein
MSNSSLSALAKRAKDSVQYTLQSLGIDDAKTVVSYLGLAGGLTVIATGHGPLLAMYDGYQSGAIDVSDISNTFKEHINDVFTLNGEQNAVTGVGFYAVVAAVVADYGSAFISSVNRMANKCFPELYGLRIDKAAQNVASLYTELSKHKEVEMYDLVENTSIYRYIAGVDSIMDTTTIMKKSADIASNEKLAEEINDSMSFHPVSKI